MNRYLAILLRGREAVNPCGIAQESAGIGLDTTTRRMYIRSRHDDNNGNGGGDGDNKRATRGKRMATTITLRVKAT